MSSKSHPREQEREGGSPPSKSADHDIRTLSQVSSLHGEPTEASPLLSHGSAPSPAPDARTWRQHLPRSPEAIVLIICLVVLLTTLGDQLQESPQTRINEAVICYRYYEKVDPSKIPLGRDRVGPGAIVGGVPEVWCKTNAVQSQLAMLRGYQQLFDGIPSLLLAVPFGWAADRFGRKPIVLLGLASFVVRFAWLQLVTWFWQAFDIRLTWLSTLHGLMGGTTTVTTGIMFVMLSDVVPEASRAAVFLRVGGINIGAYLVMPPFAAWLMEYDPWIPTLSATFILALSVLLFAFIPETLGYSHPSVPTAPHPPSPPPEPVPEPTDPGVIDGTLSTGPLSRLRIRVKNATAFLLNDWRVPAMIFMFVGHQLLGTATAILLQYCSTRYHLTFSKATLLLTIFNGGRVFLLLVALPYLSSATMRAYRLSGQTKDLYLARASFVFVCLGWALIGLSPTLPAVTVSMVVTAAGSGAFLLLRSFLTSLVPARHVARVYSIVSIADTAGAMFGGALLAALFDRGLALGGAGVGLPFYFLALMTLVFTLLLFAVRLRKGEGLLRSADAEA